MNTRDKSLRVVVEKWFGTDPAHRTRVTRSRRASARHWRFVRVESERPSGLLAIVFFRHRDGGWCVFPPSHLWPATGASAWLPG